MDKQGRIIELHLIGFPILTSQAIARSTSSYAVDMASHGKLSISTSPKSGNGERSSAVASSSPKGQCLCSPTTHQGSFRCRLHRSSRSSAAPMMKRSNSMPPKDAPASLSPKSVEST
ncbi:hypothetical protein NC652_039734 [Populus alba x Populus x berolinensis]|nr:hypothetical protein NC652_039734 [Populus alba x Populus x berolinensis]